MKGSTNATERAVTVKTGVTVDMMKNIPEDVPWDLAFISSSGSPIIIHDIGPVTTTMKAIVGTGYVSTSTSTTVQIINSMSADYNKITVNYRSITGSRVSSGSFDMTDTDLANAKLYLYGGGV